MNLKSILMVGTLFLTVGVSIEFQNSDQKILMAEAKSKRIKSFPKTYRRTWYQYSGSDYNKLIIKSQTLEFVYPVAYFSSATGQSLWSRKTHGYTWVVAQDKDKTAGTKFLFRTTTKKWSGKKHKALVEVRGSAFSMPVIYYAQKTTHK